VLLCLWYGPWVRNKISLLYHYYCESGRRQRGGQWCPVPPFEIGAPHFMFGPPVAAYIQYCILKMWPPLLVFGPSFSFLAPPAGTSWRRACHECVYIFEENFCRYIECCFCVSLLSFFVPVTLSLSLNWNQKMIIKINRILSQFDLSCWCRYWVVTAGASIKPK